MPNILLIDTDEDFIIALRAEITRLGHAVDAARTLTEGIEMLASQAYDVVFLNAEMPDGKGANALPTIMETTSLPEVIVFTDSGDPDEAERTIKMGAWDYIERPATAKAMILHLVRAIQYLSRKIPRHPHLILKQETLEDIVGSSTAMKRCMERLALSAHSDANVLISGETGTGKELFARAIHNNSPRAGGRFVVVDCAALPETLVESTLFGFEKGAFTGADKARLGLIKRADGGTLFLDEVGELPLNAQKSFLRVLQERSFRPVGGKTEISSDFRLISATNRNVDLHPGFRKDLLFRLRAFTIDLPPLRERTEDMGEICARHMARLCAAYHLPTKRFSSDFLDVIARYDWPGNVRELVHALERAVAAAGREPVIFPKHLPVYVRVLIARAAVSPPGREDAEPEIEAPRSPAETRGAIGRLADLRNAAIAELEQRYLGRLMTTTEDMREACAIAGLSRSRLYALMKKYRIRPPFRVD